MSRCAWEGGGLIKPGGPFTYPLSRVPADNTCLYWQVLCWGINKDDVYAWEGG